MLAVLFGCPAGGGSANIDNVNNGIVNDDNNVNNTNNAVRPVISSYNDNGNI